MNRVFAAVLGGLSSLATFGISASAGVIVGGSSIIDNSDVAQLETWLDQGPVTLTNIFSKSAGDTSSIWHTAVDGQGPTLTLLSIRNGDTTHVIGGYNAYSWSSISGWNYVAFATDTSFLFNLTDTLKFGRERYTWSSYNNVGSGPTFGAGHDLYVNSTLSGGYANIGYSYGDPALYGTSAYRNSFTGSYIGWTVLGLETFTIGEYSGGDEVPEPATLVLFGFGLAGLAAARRKRSSANK